MTQYLDASAIVKLYVAEDESAVARETIEQDRPWIAARHTYVEVRRTLARALGGRELAAARAAFESFWGLPMIVELTETVCRRAADIGEEYGSRTLDALHLAAAEAVGLSDLAFHTYDVRQAAVARALGWAVVGAQ